MKLDFQQVWNTLSILIAIKHVRLLSEKKETNMSDADKDVLAVVDLILDGVGVVVDAEKDGKIDLSDLPLVMKLIPDLGPAFSNLAKVPSELGHMSQEDAGALVAHVIEKLAVTDAHARGIIDAALKAAVSVYALVSAIRAPAAPAPTAA
jgi:hypothetical protein